MLNSPDWKITHIFTNVHSSECPWAVRVHFVNRKTMKKSETLFEGKESYLKVSRQARDQITLREYVKVADEPAQKKSVAAEPAPIIGKSKKKKG